MLNLISTNLVAILASTLSAIVVAGIWYSPAVFGNLWQKEAGIKKKDIRASFASKSAIALVMIFVTAVVLQRFLIITNPSSVFEAIKVAVWIWAGFVATYVIAGGVFEKVSARLMIIDLSGQILILSTMSAVLYILAS
jgi:Protein of unknown function (DUF1761)